MRYNIDRTRFKKVWVTSDPHLFHKQIPTFQPLTRPQGYDRNDTVSLMINKWNNTVGANDLVFILGDVSFGTPEETVKALGRMNGVKVLVVGNHDSRNMKDKRFLSCFQATADIMRAYYDDQLIVMCHFPIAFWHNKGHGSMHLHGHMHGSSTGLNGRLKDVGWDTVPGGGLYLLDDVVKELIKKDPRSHHSGIVERSNGFGNGFSLIKYLKAAYHKRMYWYHYRKAESVGFSENGSMHRMLTGSEYDHQISRANYHLARYQFRNS